MGLAEDGFDFNGACRRGPKPLPISLETIMQSRTRSYDLKDGILSPFVAAALMLLLFACVAAFAQSPAPNTPRLAGQTPRRVLDGSAVLVEHYNPSNMLRLAFALNPPHPEAEAAFLEAVQDKNSPLFHQYLSAADWNEQFGPTVADEQAVADWAKASGMNITYRYNNRLVVDVEAPAGVIEKALNVSINSYKLTQPDGTLSEALYYSNDRDPILPGSVSNIVASVHGLNSIEVMHPASSGQSHVVGPDYSPGPAIGTPETVQVDAKGEGSVEPAIAGGTEATPHLTGQTPAIGPPPSGYYQPTDIWSVGGYDYLALMNQGHCCNPTNNPGNSPVQSSIALAVFGDVSFNDVNTFQSVFNYLALNLTKIPVDGGYTCVNTAKASDDNCFEASLDTEWSVSTSNSRGSYASTAKIYIYEAPNNGSSTIDVYNHMLEDGHARVFSTSWGCEEVSSCSSDSSMHSLDAVLASMVGQGWTLVAATGDEGATAGCNDALAVQFPGSDPNVVGAGGTTLELYSSEVGWTGGTSSGSCAGNGGGSTGGFSSYFGAPGYQSYLGYSHRAVPDLALNASIGQLIVFQGGWAHPGGTSIVAPELAGFFAQEDAYLLSLGNVCGSAGTSPCAPLGNANYAIYSEGRYHDAAHVPFYDIVSGCNSNDITTKYHLTAYCAKAGYDEVTGWGSANMLQLAWAINWQTAAANGVPYVTFSGPATNKWYNKNEDVSWTVVDYPGAANHKPTGIAGFNQGWDSIPADATSEPHIETVATTNTFYAGPQFTNVKTGCLALASGQGCSGGVSQGCHTAHVRGWNNMGETTGDSTYGPVCYDTVAPTVSDSVANSPTGQNGWYVKEPVVFLYSSDPGGSAASGVAQGYYGINKPTCTTSAVSNCSTWSNQSIVSVTTQGHNVMNYFAEDKAGNFSTVNTVTFNFDDTAPVSTLGLSGVFSGGEYQGVVTVKLTATDNASGVAKTYYSLDGGATTTYTAAFKITSAGTHTLKFWSVDVAGNVEKTNTDSFKNN